MLLAAADEAANGQIYNLGSDEVISLADLAQIMVEVNGSGEYRIVPFPPERKAIDIGDYYANYYKVKHALGWQPRIKLREGIRRSLEYYRANREKYW
jgi:UDP-glucose 4-epimerase